MFALLPLVVLAAAFEAVYAVHTAVERVGRYVQVFFEEAGDGWEHTAMAYGAAFKGGGIDPLFCAYFWSATLLNLIPMLLAEPVTPEWIVLGAAHLAVIWRIAGGSPRGRGPAGRRPRTIRAVARRETAARLTRVSSARARS